MVQQWRGPPWNAPIWPMIPLLLNRSIEVAALCLKNVFTSITVSLHCRSDVNVLSAGPPFYQCMRSGHSIDLVWGKS